MLPKLNKIISICALAFLIFEESSGATINSLQVGPHPDYYLLVITCDKDVVYTVRTEGKTAMVDFSAGTTMNVRTDSLLLLKDNFLQSIRFDPANFRLIVELKRDFDLSTYHNRHPFQLVMDFALLPEKSVRQDISQMPTPTVAPKPAISSKIEANKTTKADSLEPDSGKIPVENLPQDPYERGIMLKQKGDLSGALQAFQEAIPNKQNTARYQVALLYEELHQRENAIKELLQVVQENPNWIEPRIKLGLLYQLSGRKDIARKIWEQVLAVAEEDTALNYSKLEEQLALLEKMVNAGKVKLDEKPLISLKNFPKLPWIWILILIVVGGIVVLIRVISNWRLNKMMRLALEEEDTEVKEAKIKEEILVEEPVEKSPASARSEDLEDEKQQLIYDLVQKKYTIAEIAKMLNIGQEEVKFILDFRSKGEIKGKKLKI